MSRGTGIRLRYFLRASNGKGRLDFSEFLKGTGLDESLGNMRVETVQNRVLLGRVFKQSYGTGKSQARSSIRSLNPEMLEQLNKMENLESTVSLEKKTNNSMISGLVSKVLSTISNGTKYVLFLISQKPLNSINEEYFAIDDEIVDKGVLGDPIKFNKIFFFNHSSKGVYSSPKKVLGVENIQSVNGLIYKGQFYLKINLENGKLYFFSFENATTTWLWLNGLRKSIQIEQEFGKLKFGVLKYNIGMVYQYQAENKWVEIDQIISGVLNGLDSNLPIAKFLDQIRASTSETNFFCDAFFAYKPFVQSLFEALIKMIHVGMRSNMMDFWNKNYIELSAGEILSFGRALLDYKRILGNWGVVDLKMDSSIRPVVATFSNRLFSSSREILFNVIDEAMFQFRKDGSFYQNDSIRILEAHLNICFDNYGQLPIVENAEQLVRMSMMMVTIVQMNLITQLADSPKSLDIEVLASLLNNDFDQMIQQFMKKVHKKTKNELTLSRIRYLVNVPYFQRNQMKISQVCLEALNERVSIEVDSIFYMQKLPFHKFKMETFLTELEARLGPIFLGLRKEHEKFDIIDKLSLQLVHLYFEDFVKSAEKIKHKHVEKLLVKVPEDRQRLLNYFRPLVGVEVDCHFLILKDLGTFLATHDYELTRILILKFIAFFGKKYELPENIKRLVSSKVYFSPVQSEQMLKGFLQIREEFLLEKRRSKSVVRYVKKLNPRVRQFVNILKERLRQRQEKTRSSNLDFRPQNTNLNLQIVSIDQIFNFSAQCKLVKFPLEIDDLQVEEHIDSHFEKKGK